MTLQKEVAGDADAYGAVATTWTDVDDVWAEVRDLAGVEAQRAAQVYPEATVEVTMRYCGDMTTAKRFRFGTRYLYPVAVISDTRNTWLTIVCKELK